MKGKAEACGFLQGVGFQGHGAGERRKWRWDRLYDALLEAASRQLFGSIRFTPGGLLRSVRTSTAGFQHASLATRPAHRPVIRTLADVLLQIACFLGRNSAYVDRAAIAWSGAPDPDAFLAERATNIIDHGHPEFIARISSR